MKIGSYSLVARVTTLAAWALILVQGGPRMTQAQTQTYIVLHSFTGGTDGSFPVAPVVLDSAGNLYGASSSTVPPPGLSKTTCGKPGACGAVFKVNRVGAETTLHSFLGAPDGAQPVAGLVRDAHNGNLYGTTALGGDALCSLSESGCGAVFEINTAGKEKLLYSFTGRADGARPVASLIQDSAGSLYGTTYFGGDLSCESGAGCGIVFKLTTAGVETVIHRFSGGTDGQLPAAGLLRDAGGDLYGTTLVGGTYGAGTVFKINASGKEELLYSFTGGLDGSLPSATLVRDATGNLYGTTEEGGAYLGGVVFEVNTTGEERVLHSFQGGTDGSSPLAGVVIDRVGNLYGTTFSGGGTGCEGGCGTVFTLSRSGVETILHSFTGHRDGGYPQAALIRDPATGTLYGTTEIGGSFGAGAVFRLLP